MVTRSSFAARLVALVAAVVLAACGGGSANPPPPPEPTPGGPQLVPPTITQQPQSLTVTAGQPASFSVAASGTLPLTYQWQRNGSDIAGATGTTYGVPAAALGDSGATFRAVVRNVAGSATSDAATLTVTMAAPVLTITPQPANVSVVAGSAASFSVGGTCSSGTLTIQWQRNSGTQGAFVDIAGATATTYTLAATAAGDSGAQFRAVLACGGQSQTASNAATLTVTAPGSVTLSLYPLVGLRDQARIEGVRAIDRLPDGSHALVVESQLKRLAADRLSIVDVTSSRTPGDADGPAATAQFRNPSGITHDADGVLYVADTGSHTIRRVATDGTVTTIAGSAGNSGTADGTGSAARFSGPSGIVLGPDGDLYVADRDNASIRRVTTAGVVTTYAGASGSVGYVDGSATAARFRLPSGLAFTANGDLLVADSANNRVRRVLRAGTAAGNVETVAGSGAFVVPGADGTGTAAVIPFPEAIAVQGGAAWVRDNGGLIRRIDLATTEVTTFAGSRTLGAGYADGPPGAARLGSTGFGMAADGAGGFLVADNFGLRRVDAGGDVRTFASRSGSATDAGTGVLAQLPLSAAAIAVDGSGRVANYDNASRAVRRVDASGNVGLAAGLTGSFGGAVDGTGSAAQFANPGGSIAAAAGDVLYVGDAYALRRIAADGTVTTIAGSTTDFGAADGSGAAARFNSLAGLAVGPGGDVFVADSGNFAIRRVTPAGAVTTVAGVFGQSSQVDGPVATARLRIPGAITVTPDGTVWFADGIPGSQVLRRLSADGSTVSTVAGTVAPGGIYALASDPAGIVYYMANANLVQPGGLYAYDPATGSHTLLVGASVAQTTVLGSVSPSLPFVRSIAVLGPKRILATGATQLLLVTLP